MTIYLSIPNCVLSSLWEHAGKSNENLHEQWTVPWWPWTFYWRLHVDKLQTTNTWIVMKTVATESFWKSLNRHIMFIHVVRQIQFRLNRLPSWEAGHQLIWTVHSPNPSVIVCVCMRVCVCACMCTCVCCVSISQTQLTTGWFSCIVQDFYYLYSVFSISIKYLFA
jgi:hypothetical protein